jgi:hypothetical protein
VEWREHGKFELEGVVCGNFEGDVFVVGIFRDLDGKDL